MALAVFKTVAGRPASSWVGSTPMRSRHFLTTRQAFRQGIRTRCLRVLVYRSKSPQRSPRSCSSAVRRRSPSDQVWRPGSTRTSQKYAVPSEAAAQRWKGEFSARQGLGLESEVLIGAQVVIHSLVHGVSLACGRRTAVRENMPKQGVHLAQAHAGPWTSPAPGHFKQDVRHDHGCAFDLQQRAPKNVEQLVAGGGQANSRVSRP